MNTRLKVRLDTNRDGFISEEEFGGNHWLWGQGKPGAIILPNKDRDTSELSSESLSEFTELIIEPINVADLNGASEQYTLHLGASENAANRFTIYQLDSTNHLKRVLGVDKSKQDSSIVISEALSLDGGKFYVESTQLPDAFFEGLITLELFLLKENRSIVEHKEVVFRVAPWIMTPNTQAPIKVFTVRITDSAGQVTNQQFLNDLEYGCTLADVPLEIIEGVEYARSQGQQDRWIQDEIEFGYCQGPKHSLPIVFDGPRDRGLDKFPEAELLGSDFGHFQINTYAHRNSLDSFGNLEVSPPVKANGVEYPLGRIVFGGKKLGNHQYGRNERQMMPAIRRLLYAQKVQSPIEVFSDWLLVGHIDEFMNFIPDSSEKGFKLLLASPKLCLDSLRDVQDSFGDVLMFEGLKNTSSSGTITSAEMTINSLLDNQELLKFNEYCQDCVNINESILKRELGLTSDDIIYAPVLFKRESQRAVALFPDMVNHLVLNQYSLVPKPHGPRIDGKDYFEKIFEENMPNESNVVYVEDWYSYHQQLGEVHCGTNTLRESMSEVKWWESKPLGGFDI
ncbi:hypothetical protein BBM86_05860 [Vibrio parahaemolyticus]|uniref:protein-arginine deiminase family protein n=1 Tax=Vibrio parahaemolyticus TaxID=670 RepID=UPI00084ADD05|nr:protein-arginine deiminase family protein [Vibrio parahaemolyticus]OEB84842.1 hypothetical protein BBM86_05860 [Vibrio parahaemolyticus]